MNPGKDAGHPARWMKSLCVLARRDGFSRQEFQDYYERSHAPLGASLLPLRRYVRNHLIDAPDVGFDVIGEFWVEDFAAVAHLLDGPAGEILRSDERIFMDQSRIAPAGSEEHVLSEGLPAGPDGARTALLVSWSDDALGRASLLQWGRTLAAQQPGVSIDFLRSWGEPPFPANAVLWMPDGTPAPPPGLGVRPLRVRRLETPVEELLRA